jgi:pyruvate,water dikinase
VPCLTDEESVAVAKLARRAEKHYRCPQDVEWALDDSAEILLLQSRPETVWSRRSKQGGTGIADPITSMVHTMLHPVSGGGHAAHG